MRSLLPPLLAAWCLVALTLAPACGPADAGMPGWSSGSAPNSATGNAPTVDSTLAQCQALTPDEGDLCYPTGSPYSVVARSAGTWSYRHPESNADVTPTTAAAWPTTVTPGAAPSNWSVTDETSGLLTIKNWGNANDRGVFRALPAAPYTITLGIDPSVVNLDATFVFLVLRDSVGGSVKRWNICEYGSGAVGTSRAYNADSAWDFVSGLATVIPEELAPCTGPQLYRVRDDSTKRYFEVSYDRGATYKTVFSEGRTTHVTPDQLGIALLSYSSSTTAGLGASAAIWHYAAE